VSFFVSHFITLTKPLFTAKPACFGGSSASLLHTVTGARTEVLRSQSVKYMMEKLSPELQNTYDMMSSDISAVIMAPKGFTKHKLF